MKSSNYSGFFKLSIEECMKEVAEFCALAPEEQVILKETDSLDMDKADHIAENIIGRFTLPMGTGINLATNGKNYVIPMVTEESSVVTACSNATKVAQPDDGFTTNYTDSIIASQIQLLGVPVPLYTKGKILENKEKIAEICNTKDPILVKPGGGVEDAGVRVLGSLVGPMVVAHLLVDTGDAVSVNATDTMAKAVALFLEESIGDRAEPRVLSNLADYRIARARTVFEKNVIGGEKVIDKMVAACAFTAVDPYQTATNNKGIMSGIILVVIATGNDTRAIESGAYAYVIRSGQYSPFATWEKSADGDLVGSIETLMTIGPAGSTIKIRPTAKAAMKMLGIKTAGELIQTIAAVNLAQNTAAMRALATEGAQRDHMSLHARNLTATASATGELLGKVVKQMVSERNVRLEYAQELVKQYQE